MTMRKNAKSKKPPRITRSTPFMYLWKQGRFAKIYIDGQRGFTHTIDTIHINSTK